MRAKDGHKLILVLTLPDGIKYAVGGVNGMLSLVPLKEDGTMFGLLAFDSTDAVENWVDAFRKKNGELNWSKWANLNPRIEEIKLREGKTKLQTKDIPDAPVLNYLAQHQDKWSMSWDVKAATFPDIPDRLWQSKIRSFIKRD